MTEPLSTSCSNTGFDDNWTCPACYKDHGNVRDGNVVACSCGSSFRATLESQPVCVSELLEGEDHDR